MAGSTSALCGHRLAYARTEIEPQEQPKPAFRPGLGWQLDLGLGQGYDDNLIGIGRGGALTQFDVSLDLHQAWEHGFWSLDFQPTVQRLSSVVDRVNESVSTRDSWELSRRWTLDLNGNYLHSGDPFAGTQLASEAEPTSGAVVVAPNSAFIGPGAPITIFGGSATLSYQMGRNSGLTFGGNYFSNRGESPLPSINSPAFYINYTKMVHRGHTIGFLYSAQSFDVTNPEERVTTHSLLLSYGYEPKLGWQIALWAGPQYSLIDTNSVNAAGSYSPLTVVGQSLLGYSAGATLSRLIAKRSFFQLMASRHVTNGAGTSGAVISNAGQLSLSRPINKRLSVYVGGFYSEYEQLGNLPVSQPNAWGAFNLAAFEFTPRSSISIRYDYSYYVPIPSYVGASYSHQRVLIEYHYSFGKLPDAR